MSLAKLQARLADMVKAYKEDLKVNGKEDHRARRDIEALQAALSSGDKIKASKKAIEAAQAVEATAQAEVNRAQAVVTQMEQLLATEQTALETATAKAGAQALAAVKSGASLDSVIRPSQGGVDMAVAALEAATAELEAANAALEEAIGQRQEQEQNALYAKADATRLALYLAEAEYIAALSAHHLTYWNANRSQFTPLDVNEESWRQARAIMYGDD